MPATLPPLTADDFEAPEARTAFAMGVLYGMQATAEVLEDNASEQLEAGQALVAGILVEVAEGVRAAVDQRFNQGLAP